MLNTTVKAYATRAAASLALALAVTGSLLITGQSTARPSPSATRGHAVLTGRAEAVDGDTLAVGGVRVRLEGIDAPEIMQTCTDASGKAWECGAEATRILARLVANVVVSCEERGLDKYKRLLGVCRAGGIEVNAELVRRGLAWAFTRYSQTYVSLEAEARRARLGIWAGAAQPAWDYRAERWQVAETSTEAPKGCPIKGNVTANGRIYHVPWSPWYGKVKMDEGKGKRWFCTEEEAIKAGWRAAHVN